MRKTLKAVMGLLVLLGVFYVATPASPAGAQECVPTYFDPCTPEPECSFEGTYPARVTAGSRITLTGTAVNVDSIEFAIGGSVIGSVTPDADGNFSGTFTVPSLAAGTYSITATAQSDCGEFTVEEDIEVVATQVTNPVNNNVNGSAGNTTSDTPLARTGFDAAPMVTLGAAALVLGAAAVYGSKRRRTA